MMSPMLGLIHLNWGATGRDLMKKHKGQAVKQDETHLWRGYVPLVLLALASSVHAKCIFEDVPAVVKSDAMVLGNLQVGRHLHASPMNGHVSFKCDVNTKYSLVVDGGGGNAVDVAMLSNTGARIPSRITILTIGNAKAVPDVVVGRQLTQTFSGFAEKDKTYNVAFNVQFDDLPVQSRDNARSDFMGRMQFSLNY